MCECQTVHGMMGIPWYSPSGILWHIAHPMGEPMRLATGRGQAHGASHGTRYGTFGSSWHSPRECSWDNTRDRQFHRPWDAHRDIECDATWEIPLVLPLGIPWVITWEALAVGPLRCAMGHAMACPMGCPMGWPLGCPMVHAMGTPRRHPLGRSMEHPTGHGAHINGMSRGIFQRRSGFQWDGMSHGACLGNSHGTPRRAFYWTSYRTWCPHK